MSDTDESFDLKLQLANEYLRNGGMEGICDVDLLQDLIDFNRYDEKTHTSRLKAFIYAIFLMNITPPPVLQDSMNEYKSFVQKDLFFDQIKIETEEQIDELFEKYKDKARIFHI